MKANGLKEVYIDELKDLYDAENQLVKALPKMAKAAESEELRSAFEEHLEQTREHVARLERIFKGLGESPKRKKYKGIQGLIEEGSETIEEDYEPEQLDAAIIGAAQRVEHYEIAGYGTAQTFAQLLNEDDAVSLLEETLEEEKEADQKLSQIAEEINVEAVESEEGEQDQEEATPENADSRASAKGPRKGKAKSARA